MAFGDVGGSVTELIITCKTEATGTVAIKKGDAVKLVEAYTVSNATADEDVILGQAMADVSENGAALPVKVRGISVFEYEGATAPTVDGEAGILGSAEDGKVKPPATGNGVGINLKVDGVSKLVHVLM